MFFINKMNALKWHMFFKKINFSVENCLSRDFSFLYSQPELAISLPTRLLEQFSLKVYVNFTVRSFGGLFKFQNMKAFTFPTRRRSFLTSVDLLKIVVIASWDLIFAMNLYHMNQNIISLHDIIFDCVKNLQPTVMTVQRCISYKMNFQINTLFLDIFINY